MDGRDDYRDRDYATDPIRWLAAGFGMGLLIGGALGLLLAPKSGRETREQMIEMAGDWSRKAKDFAGDVTERAKTTAATVTDRAKAVTESVKGTYSTAKEAIPRVVDAAKQGYKKTVEELGKGGDGSQG